MSVFGNVWLYSAVAFVIGVLLTWAFWVRPLQKRLAAAKRDVVASREQAARQDPAASPTLFEPDAGSGEGAIRYEPEPATSLLQPFAAGESLPAYPAEGVAEDYDDRPYKDTEREYDDELSDPGYAYPSAGEYRESEYYPGDVSDDDGPVGENTRVDLAPSDAEVPDPEEFERAEPDTSPEPATVPDDETDTTRDDHDAAYLAYLERERAKEQDGPESHAGDLFTPSSGSGGDLSEDGGFDPAEIRGALSLNGDYGSAEQEMPVVPELPEVSGNDLTPFDPFAPDSGQGGYPQPSEGTSQLEYVTAEGDETEADEDGELTGAAGINGDSTVTGILPAISVVDESAAEPREGSAPATDLFTPASAREEQLHQEQAAQQEAQRAPGSERSLFEPVVAAAAGEGEQAAESASEMDDETPEVRGDDSGPSAEEPPAGPFGPGSALSRVDGGSPSPEFEIKARTSSMVFHTPNSPFYERLLPQVWFRTEEDAKRAGFTSWERPQNS